MNPQDRRQNRKQAFEASEPFSLSPAEGEGAGMENSSPLKSQLHLATLASARASTFDRLCARSMPLPTLNLGAGRAELAKFVRPFGLAASRSPSPWPSPAGRGNGHPASFSSRASLPLAPCAPRFNAETPARPSALDSPRSGGRFSLSPRERAGVRGKSCDPVDQIHAQSFDATLHLVPSPFQGEREFTTEMWCGLRTSQ